MKVRLLIDLTGLNPHRRGELYDCSAAEARDLVANGYAAEVEAEARVMEAPETAAKPRARGRKVKE